jgi:hypothetical protein
MAAPSRSQPTAYSARLTLNHQRLANAPELLAGASGALTQALGGLYILPPFI